MLSNSRIPSHQDVLDELAAAREKARLEMHLLSLDARAAWSDLEKRLLQVQGSLEQDGAQLTEGLVAKARELTRSAREFIERRRDIRVARLDAKVDSLMTKEVVTCSPGDSLERAAQILWDHDCGVVPIISDEGQLVGMLTDRDVCMAAYTRGQPLRELVVSTAMSRDIHTCSPDDDIERALHAMRNKRLRRLPVVSQSGHLLGIVSLADVARRLETSADANAAIARSLAEISKPERVRIAAE